MATYNGEKYLAEQLGSILPQLGAADEVIISDDGSTDGTAELIREMMKTEPRIKLVCGEKKGVIKNFENAIKHTTGDIIFLSDQDDIWEKDKVRKVTACFRNSDATCVIHDAKVVRNDYSVIEPSFYSTKNSCAGAVHNIVRNSYIGCCMAFRRELLDYVLPFPENIHMHDQWIGVLSDIYGKTIFLNDVLLSYRRHDDNVSAMTHYPVRIMLKNRAVFVKELMKRRRLIGK